MAEITGKAYESIRNYIVESFTRVELRDDNEERIINLPIDGDERFNWIHPTKQEIVDLDDLGNPIYADVPDSQTLQLEIIITGADSGITLPVTFAQSVLQDDISNDLSIESFTPFEMTQEEDQITITHNIEVPQL